MSVRYQAGSCVVCGNGTDTALAVEGEAEWHIALLIELGVPEAEAPDVVSAGTNSDPGKVPAGRFKAVYRVCAACVERAPADFPAPVLFVEGGTMPMIVQPPEDQELD
jgi:hypothetical protein